MGWMEELKSPGALQASLNEHGPRVATVVLAGLVAIQAGILVTAQGRGASIEAASGRDAASVTLPSAQARRPTLRVRDIVAAHLFGEAAPAATDGNAPQTAVQLVLAGVMAVSDPKRGLAIIGPSAAAARLYTVGDAVPGGVKLYSVYAEHVLLDRDGSIESLQLPKKLALASAPPPPVVGGNLSPGQRLAALAQGNGALLGGLVRATPVTVGGKLNGFRVYPGGRASIATFTQLGLRPGDLVTAVNGTQLDDVNRGNEILQTLSSAASATLTVQRNGQSQDLNLNLETVVSEAERAAAQTSGAMRRGGAFGGGLAPGSGMGRVPGMAGSVAAPGVVDDDNAPPPPPAETPPETTPNDQ
jgi:general secretion pathway protein C